MRARVLRILVGSLVLVLTACGRSDQSDLAAYVEKVKAREPGPVEPLPEVKQVDTFVYEPGNRRDPFLMDERSADVVNSRGPAGGPAPDPLRPKEELEQYSLDTLRMKGSLVMSDTTWGLVQTPDGILHQVRVGNFMGKNNGQVTAISEQEIQLTELVSNGGGDYIERQTGVALSQ